eukprot:PhM_4_TR11704/c0_g1_i1/m.85962
MSGQESHGSSAVPDQPNAVHGDAPTPTADSGNAPAVNDDAPPAADCPTTTGAVVSHPPDESDAVDQKQSGGDVESGGSTSGAPQNEHGMTREQFLHMMGIDGTELRPPTAKVERRKMMCSMSSPLKGGRPDAAVALKTPEPCESSPATAAVDDDDDDDIDDAFFRTRELVDLAVFEEVAASPIKKSQVLKSVAVPPQRGDDSEAVPSGVRVLADYHASIQTQPEFRASTDAAEECRRNWIAEFRKRKEARQTVSPNTTATSRQKDDVAVDDVAATNPSASYQCNASEGVVVPVEQTGDEEQ